MTRPARRQLLFRSDRNPDGGSQPSEWTVGEHDVAAVRASDIARDSQTQPGAAFVLIARVVEPQNGLEPLFAKMGWDPGPVGMDGNRGQAMAGVAGDRYRGGV